MTTHEEQQRQQAQHQHDQQQRNTGTGPGPAKNSGDKKSENKEAAPSKSGLKPNDLVQAPPGAFDPPAEEETKEEEKEK